MTDTLTSNEIMKRHLVQILIILMLTLGSIVGCGGVIDSNEMVTERDKAVTFFKGAYPIKTEIQAISNGWNGFLQSDATYASNPEEVINKSQEYRFRLEALQYDLSMLDAPPPLRQLKDDLALSVSTGVETFMLGELCARNLLKDYCYRASYKLQELRSLIVIVADEWDDGLANYDIESSEISP